MIVFSINRVLNWCQVITGTGTYTCPIKELNGELFFRFKKDWHPVTKYITERTRELIKENGKIFEKSFIG